MDDIVNLFASRSLLGHVLLICSCSSRLRSAILGCSRSVWSRVFQQYSALSLDELEAGTRSALRRHNFVRLMSSVDLLVFHDGLT